MKGICEDNMNFKEELQKMTMRKQESVLKSKLHRYEPPKQSFLVSF
jgi:hypothetical protein